MSIIVACECGARFNANEQHRGRSTICPKCGRYLLIQPSNSPTPIVNKKTFNCAECGQLFDATQVVKYEDEIVCKRCLTEGPPRTHLSKKAKQGIVVGSGIVLLLVLVLASYFLFLRDTWERDHKLQIIVLYNNAHDLAESNQLQKALDKYNEILVLVANRQLVDDDLRDIPKSVNKWKHELEQQITIQIAIQKLFGLLHNADVKFGEKDWKSANEQYAIILDSIKAQALSGSDIDGITKNALAGEKAM